MEPPVPPPAEEPPEARAERTMLLYRIGRTGVLVHTLLVGAALYMFWGHVPTPLLAGWAGLMLAITAWRAAYCRAVTRRASSTGTMGRYQVIYDRLILLTGVWWGVGTVLLFVPQEPGLQAVLALLVGGTAAGAVGTLSANLGTVFRALLPSLLPLSANFLLRGEDEETLAIGGLMLLFLGALGVVARNFNATLREALRLRYDLAAKSRALEADIAHRERVEAELREATRLAETAVAAKSRFLARASHDLRQPLHALGLLVAALDRRLVGPEDRDLLWRIEQSVESMSLLFNALLDISRLDAGAVHPEVRAFRLDDLLAPMIDEFRLLAEVKGLRLRHVPTRAVVRSDPGLLSAILRNLISNAIRYTPQGGVLVGCRRQGDALRLEVRDTGIGIPADQRDQVFEEFVQITHGDGDRRGRFGLGLSIVRRLAEVLDHPLALRSMAGQGSCFSLVLATAPAVEAGAALPAEGGLRRHSLNALHVLVVEDDEDVREATAHLLCGWGARVTTAGDGAAALAAATGNGGPPDVAVVDLDLPDQDGRAVIASLRAACGPTLPAVLVTGDILAQPQAGDPPLLHKPIPPARLRTLLNQTARRRPAD